MNTTSTHRRSMQSPLRVAFLTPGLGLGGAERWIVTLAKYFNRTKVMPVGIFVTSSQGDEAMIALARRECPVIWGNNDDDLIRAELTNLRLDVLVSWGVPNLAELVAELDMPIVDVSHSSPEWKTQTALLHASSRGATHWAAVSSAAAAAFPVDENRTVTVLPNGIDLARIEPIIGRAAQRRAWSCNEWPLADEDRLILFLGRLAAEKRAKLIISALTHLPNHYKAILVGPDGGERARLIDEAARYAPGRVAFLGHQESIGDLLVAADLFCLPSRFEGQSLALLEALAAGLPVVTCNYAANQEWIARRMVWSVPVEHSPAQLAASIRSAMENEQAREICRRARELVRRDYCAPAMAGRWEVYLRQVAA